MIRLSPTRTQHSVHRRPARRFCPGDLVRHVRYGYRGVVVDVDERCRAPDGWYSSNKTQPQRAQPWYHVLVDGADSATYAAQTSLDIDIVGAPIEHPLVGCFFSRFDDGLYVRNGEPWPGWP